MGKSARIAGLAVFTHHPSPITHHPSPITHHPSPITHHPIPMLDNVRNKPFCVEEATIAELHQAIRDGRTTCVDVVRQYIARARAYNGPSSLLVTESGVPVPEATGAVRAQAPLKFPTETFNASALLPDLDQYQGPPLEFGRMEPTVSDPSVQQQYGMIVGKPNAGQVNAWQH